MRVHFAQHRIIMVAKVILAAILLAGCNSGTNQKAANEDVALRYLDTTILHSAAGEQLTEMGLGSWIVTVPSLHVSQGPVKILEPVLIDSTEPLGESIILSPIRRIAFDLNHNPKRWLVTSLSTGPLPSSLTFQTGSFSVAFGIAFKDTPPDGSFSLGIRYEMPGQDPEVLPLDVTVQVVDSKITVSTPFRYPGGRSGGIGPRGGGVR